MIQDKKPNRNLMPRDTEAISQWVEYVSKRLGMVVDYSDYVGAGVYIDDDGGIVDDVNNLGIVLDDVLKRLGKLEATTVGDKKKPGRPKKEKEEK